MNRDMNWISVKDRLPEDRKYVLVWESDWMTWDSAFFESGSFKRSEDYTTIKDVTHWAIVEPPQEFKQ